MFVRGRGWAISLGWHVGAELKWIVVVCCRDGWFVVFYGQKVGGLVGLLVFGEEEAKAGFAQKCGGRWPFGGGGGIVCGVFVQNFLSFLLRGCFFFL